jgi:hypothetical protein
VSQSVSHHVELPCSALEKSPMIKSKTSEFVR